MAKSAKRVETETEETPFSRVSEDNTTDILLRLPAKSVLRAGAVWRPWRCITTDPSFLAALQPAEVILYSYKYPSLEVALELVPRPVSSGDGEGDEPAARRRLIRNPRASPFLLLASCNGVLLFQKSEGSFILCNPMTRQWADLPRIPCDRFTCRIINYEYAFYWHQPSGEYRVLVCRGGSWFILATGAAEARRVDMSPGAWIADSLVTTPVTVNGRVHWPPRQATVTAATEGASSTTMTTMTATEMVVFDTASETFHRMAGPPTATPDVVKLFEMDGMLAAADFGEEEHVELWFLEDYAAGRWERRHRIATAWQLDMNRAPPREARDLVCVGAAGDGEGNVVLGSHLWLAAYNVRTKTTRTLEAVARPGNNVLVSRHVFRESLAPHPSFAARSAADLGFTFSWF